MNIPRGDHGRQAGFSVLIVPLVIISILLVGAVAFGAWAYSNMQDYKLHIDKKVNDAVVAAQKQEAAAKDAQFVEQEKLPYRTYTSPSTYGNITVKYPKTWSAYVIDTHDASPFVDGYFYPNAVPDIQDPNSAFALRVQLVQQSYSSVLTQFSQYVQQGQTRVTPYSLANVPSVVGSRIDGKISDTKNGSMVVFPLRNMTLQVWTEAPAFQVDFDNAILPNLTFVP